MHKFVLSIAFIFSCLAGSAAAQQLLFNDPMQGPICSGPLGPGPCAAVMQYIRNQQMGGGTMGMMGGGMPPPIMSPNGIPAPLPPNGGLPGAGMLPQDGQIVAMIGQRCGGQPVCMAGAWGSVEIQRCRNGFGVSGGCFGPNGEIMKVLNRVLPQNLQPNVIARNVQNDIQNGPGRNNDLVGCNGAVNRFFGGSC